MVNENSENLLVEQPTIALFNELGYKTVNAFKGRSQVEPKSMLGRETAEEVVLVRELLKALRRLNPTLPPKALQLASDELTRSRAMLTPEYANYEIYMLLKDGVQVSYVDDEGDDISECVHVIDWKEAKNNDFLLVSQLTIQGDLYTRRPDLLGYVNGLPLVFCELKTSHRRVEDAYHGNLTDYKKLFRSFSGITPSSSSRMVARACSVVSRLTWNNSWSGSALKAKTKRRVSRWKR